jgi:hypothetical protein
MLTNHPTPSSVLRRLLLPALVAGTVAIGVLASERDASAQAVEVGIAPPSGYGYVWAPGYWGYRPGYGRSWYGGRWERRGYGREWDHHRGWDHGGHGHGGWGHGHHR